MEEIEILTDINEIRNRIEEAPTEELKLNLYQCNECILKTDKNKVYAICSKVASIAILSLGTLMLTFVPDLTIKGVGISMLAFGIINAVDSSLQHKHLSKKSSDMKEVQKSIEDEINYRQSMLND